MNFVPSIPCSAVLTKKIHFHKKFTKFTKNSYSYSLAIWTSFLLFVAARCSQKKFIFTKNSQNPQKNHILTLWQYGLLLVAARCAHVLLRHREQFPPVVPLHRLLVRSVHLETGLHCRPDDDRRELRRPAGGGLHARHEEENLPLHAQSAHFCAKHCTGCWVSCFKDFLKIF